ncbi:serine hydrolase domain-containing protein [Kangiella koreensis]|uniref:Beta-lactamase n=1 Tax=Kangiella koreensis (strain DSM 16069 / JCM 12317 / KCTC 12182 / SW-125) TaxID=523791 RepID=C7RD25_KANKD|nr:serine hydrolase domain-containing protein [Kangiella koreensis]ACV27167.1 beta-lactamase [Kangiella koreensis DSM 16069]
MFIKHTLALACMICTTACSASSNPAKTQASTQDFTAPPQVQKIVKHYAETAKIPGVAVAYIKDGKTQWVSLYGEASEENPVKETTLFNVASLTKPVFSMLTLQLVEEGKLTLDESLSQYWVDPDVKSDPRHNELTARLVLSHQTGFPNWRRDKPLAFMFSPGERHEYSGEGFDYLRKAVEVNTDMTMPKLMTDYITKPLAMNNTYFGWQPDKDASIATRYDEAAQEIEHKPFYKDSYSAACCTLTTINDYSKFIAWVGQGAGLSDELLSDVQTLQSQHDNPVEYYGLGWRLIKLPETTYLMHDGREPGVRAFATVAPETGEGLVILTNSSNGELLYRPLIESTLSVQNDYLAQTDKDAWVYLTSVPKEVQPRMIQFIAKSPSFVSKALYAANEAVFTQSGLQDKNSSTLKKKAENQIDNYVLGMVDGKYDGQTFINIMSALSQSLDDTVLLKHDLNEVVTVDGWVALLKQTTEASKVK